MAAATLLAAACGAGDETDDVAVARPAAPGASVDARTPAGPDAPAGPNPQSPTGAAATDLPDLEVVDVATGTPVQLRSLVPSDRPTLLWFWAPH